jgi:hypothetical protein
MDALLQKQAIVPPSPDDTQPAYADHQPPLAGLIVA